MAQAKAGKRRRKPVSSPKVFNVTIRLTEEQYDKIRSAAGPYPASTWARVELLRRAEEVLRGKGGR